MIDRIEEKTVRTLAALSSDMVLELTGALKTGNYQIRALAARPDALPTGVLENLLKDAAYRFILDDEAAYFQCFGISYPGNAARINIPAGVYGVSPAHKICFPIIIGDVVSSFIACGKAEVSQITGITSAPRAEACYALMAQIKTGLIRKIFQFYAGLRAEYNPVMCWEIRGEGSNTRKVAEAIPFARLEDPKLNREYYYQQDLQTQQVGYLRKCTLRWSNSSGASTGISAAGDVPHNTRLFYTHLLKPANEAS